jgi:hypothetical protein
MTWKNILIKFTHIVILGEMNILENPTYVRILRNAVIWNSFRILTLQLGFSELAYI